MAIEFWSTSLFTTFPTPNDFDVIVFKNPNNGKQNYIKRLIGLPGEHLVIENGDIFRIVDVDGQRRFEIIRKPSSKLRAMLQVVDDTNYIPDAMHQVGWPLRWQQWHGGSDGGWESTVDDSKPTYTVDAGDEVKWLQYRHLVPLHRTRKSGDELDWKLINDGELPDCMKEASPLGTLITDYYCYNDRDIKKKGAVGSGGHQPSYAMHWVGDLAVDCWTQVEGDTGILKLQLVEGGAKFICTIDVATGDATLSCSESTVQFVDADGKQVEKPIAKTNLKGSGKYRILFANVDDQIHLSINNQFASFDTATFTRTDKTFPRFDPDNDNDLGDAEPIGIGAENLKMTVTRLKVLRDVYYTSPTGLDQNNIADETNFGNYQRAWKWFDNPDRWESESAQAYFKSRFRKNPYVFELADDQFLPMGDNSPSSLDGRVWDGPKNVSRDMLIGRALFIYWPHALNSPVPYVPNFQKMKFIR